MSKIKVAPRVLEGLKKVRDSGRTNMFDYPEVIRIALEFGYPEVGLWIDGHLREYSTGVIYGFEEEMQEENAYEQ